MKKNEQELPYKASYPLLESKRDTFKNMKENLTHCNKKRKLGLEKIKQRRPSNFQLKGKLHRPGLHAKPSSDVRLKIKLSLERQRNQKKKKRKKPWFENTQIGFV